MARFSKAVWKPLGIQTESRMRAYDLLVFHTMVGYMYSTDAMFRQGGYSGLESHFGVGGIWGSDKDRNLDGVAWQWQDTLYQAQANGEGNPRIISVETADNAPSSSNDLLPWTPKQFETNAQVAAWAHLTHNIPLVLAPNSLPGSKGIGYHRQGIDPWRVPGGEVWSSSRGKVCPGDRRIAQIPGIIARARQIVSGDDVTAEEVWNYPIIWPKSVTDVPHARNVYPARDILNGANIGAARALAQAKLAVAQVTGLTATVKTLAELLAKDTEDLSAQQILDTVNSAIQNAVVKVQVEVTSEEVS